jgi:hypothetical protein
LQRSGQILLHCGTKITAHIALFKRRFPKIGISPFAAVPIGLQPQRAARSPGPASTVVFEIRKLIPFDRFNTYAAMVDAMASIRVDGGSGI